MDVELAPEALRDLIAGSLDDGKAEDIRVLDVRGLTSVTDYMVVASGRSPRQVKALKDRVLEVARDKNIRPIGVEGESAGEWVLIDFGDVIVHTMRPETRDFYQLEKLWDDRAAGTDIDERMLTLDMTQFVATRQHASLLLGERQMPDISVANSLDAHTYLVCQ